jgi:preprotein translocase subunit SecD
MRERNYALLIVIIFLALLAGWIDLPENTGIHLGPFNIDTKIHFGLDIQGGLQVLLQAVGIPCEQVPADAMDSTKTVVESRINGLGVAEPLVQKQGPCRIVVQLPGISNPDEAIRTFGSTALLEFVDTGDQSIQQGTVIQTTGTSTVVVPGQPTSTPGASTPQATGQPSTTVTATATVSATTSVSVTNPVSSTTPFTTTVFRTVMTGSYLRSAAVQFSQTTNQPYIAFTLTDDGAKIFADYTAKNVHKYLTITLDKTVISSPVINSAIQGSGVIEGKFTRDEANQLALQLKYGALPIPLQVIQSTAVGPTLGRDSVNKSITAGAIGLIVVVLFMLLYYRLPGLLADLALAIYALLILAIYKFGVTLTLPGIAGFILSVGLAVDANILIFERMKEELRAGRPLALAIEAGFNRAWPSIRDSNSSTLITCGILAYFGLTQGASIVAGFAITLAIGVLTSLFTAITVSRTFLRLSIDMGVASNLWWFGV